MLEHYCQLNIKDHLPAQPGTVVVFSDEQVLCSAPVLFWVAVGETKEQSPDILPAICCDGKRPSRLAFCLGWLAWRYAALPEEAHVVRG